MGAEFIPVMSDNSGQMTAELDITRLIGGEVEMVRARLVEAFEQMGFRVINESPILARRSGTRLGAGGASNNILDFQTSITVSLKQTGPRTTRATFDYQIRNALLTKSDRRTLNVEVDAIVALATSRVNSSFCVSCGAEINTRTRYCRQCGAPASAHMPAEIESLRLTAGINAGYKGLYSGTIFMLIAMLLPLILFFLDHDAPKYVRRMNVILWLTGIMGSLGMGMLLNSIWNIRKTLYPAQEAQHLAAGTVRPLMTSPDTNSLPENRSPQQIPASITEDTTELLRSEVAKPKE